MQRLVLFAYVVALGLETGAGLFTSVAVFPVWTASPEIVIGWKPTMPYFVQEGAFFMFSSSATTLLALTLLIIHRKLPANVRPLTLGSTLAFIAMAIWTAAYFLPEQDRVQGDAGAARPHAEVAEMLNQFVALNWIRQAILVGAFLVALHALGLLYRSMTSSDA